ncbi:YqcI/YcgG family protein [Actinoalloteichus sp. GBA129-24]|uniref:YqcI/YcgG family protein n=1 Tax=Actinoalloteichus sp. GBA129-24 TaxID=1612551 RepID=UPI000950A3E3|nr:YqcI/YcgG family protein [Actinoalloteichus sp. GBA129-24]APU21282.1 hypothetical protein UA75_16370 [Actinoalloteichus sp. GBA129-24]
MTDRPDTGFARIQRRAACLFAPNARIESAAPFHGARAREAGVAAAAVLGAFAARIEADQLDGLMIELTRGHHGDCLAALAATTREVLTGLLEENDATGGELASAGSEHWWLRLHGTRWFVLTFAPCYAVTSPRHTFGSSSTFIVLQPVESFDRHATPRGGLISDAVRQRIRRAYATRGCEYDGDLAQQGVEALKFVWPRHLGEAPVRWWPSPARSEPATS